MKTVPTKLYLAEGQLDRMRAAASGVKYGGNVSLLARIAIEEKLEREEGKARLVQALTGVEPSEEV